MEKDKGEQKREQLDMVALGAGMFGGVFLSSNLNIKRTQQGPKMDIAILVEGENGHLAAM